MNKCLLVSITGYLNKFLETFGELEQLCKTLNFFVVDKIYQKRTKPDSAYYIGKGKLKKIKDFCDRNKINFIVINDNVTATQRKNIEKFLNIKLFDRTEIILEIFSRHAKTQEGKLQVEIAKLQYLLPYLVGIGKDLSRLGGGIGTRGPGEKELEYSKRYINNRIKSLKNQLAVIKKERTLRRKKRLESKLTKISIVGYTNAGKSSLLSKLSGERFLSKNEMFTTLTTYTRRVKLPSNRIAIFSDTVGFIKDLHPKIIEAFHSTLEEINYSDIVLILIDISDLDYEKKLNTVFETLENIGVYNKPYLLVFNKIDLVSNEYLKTVHSKFPNASYISVTKDLNIKELLLKIDKLIDKISKKKVLYLKPEKLNILFKYKRLIRFSMKETVNNDFKVEIFGPEEIISKILKEANK
ncbi:GTPase HflX [Thermosipho atlanticus]|uniref:GTPase HflX n=1 Tax=Thermosipho atlanticus DSM 15807 TaxID=1123380 RepID=A0A1M5SR10_9BACT|nr:GTPase HflX [Thermosipho atlanticus]SHH40880.1 GTP-binding protein HflX [Thermosipho atlanticus DSM 15807]